MASGKVHAIASLGLAAPVGMLAMEQCGARVGLAAAMGCAAGVFLSPDLDLAGRTVSESLLWKLHPLIGLPFQAFWLPYGLLFKHRGISHWPIVGTATRLAYIALVVAGMWFVVGCPDIPAFWEWPEAQMWVAGLAVSDLAHFVMDL
jgi:uncharacterized metal-binding protein